MKLLFVHDHKFIKRKNGDFYSPGQLSYELWKRYLKVFDEITVVGRENVTLKNPDFDKLNISNGPNVEIITVPDIKSAKGLLFKQQELIQKLENIMIGADVVIARMPSSIGSRAIKIAKKMGKPYMVEMVACTWDGLWNYGNIQGKIYAPYSFIKTKRTVKNSDFVLYVSEEFLQRRYPSKGHTIACSDVELSNYEPSIINKRINHIKEKKDKYIVGLVGSLSSTYKGIDTAIKSLPNVIAKFPHVEFHILGPGDKTPWETLAFKTGTDKHVFFDGVLPSGEAVYNWLDNVDLYIQPSRQEGLPRALVEAMSRGCPALGSRAGGIPELLKPECLIKPGDYKSLSHKLLNTIDNQEFMFANAKYNFKRAGDYQKELLDEKRERFWRFFLKNANIKPVHA